MEVVDESAHQPQQRIDMNHSTEEQEEIKIHYGDKNEASSDDFKIGLRRKDLTNEGELSILSETATCSNLPSKSTKKEKGSNHNTETESTVSPLGCLLLLLFTSVGRFIIIPRENLNIQYFTTGLAILVLFTVIFISDVLPVVRRKFFCKRSAEGRSTENDIIWAERTLAGAVSLVLISINALEMISCDTTLSPNCTIGAQMVTYPSYFSEFCVLVLVTASVLTRLSRLIKIAIYLAVAILHCSLNYFVISSTPKCGDYVESVEYSLFKSSLMMICVALALSFLAKYVERAARVLLRWKAEALQKQKSASATGRRNEAVVYNFVLPHTTTRFLRGSNLQDEELRGQTYPEVGILFASLPNFPDFCSGESLRDLDLEFLNEVIYDFDAILQLPKFQEVIKIKTVGSTYMAATGLNQKKGLKPDVPIQVRWAHLALLVELALMLKRALQGINEQSLQNFVLKMGISHGPITAGLRGARKNHYDIWGDSLNLAYLMGCSGRDGSIQVTEETYKILLQFGYRFEKTGFMTIEGQENKMTYHLIEEEGEMGQSAVTTGSDVKMMEHPLHKETDEDSDRE